MDDRLEGFNDIYFEAGDHETLIHVSAAVFHELMRSEPHGKFCRKLDISRPHGTDYHGA